MIRDKRGEGGFMEAMVALMFVSIALTGFLGLMSYSELGQGNSTVELDTAFIEDMYLKDGEIIGESFPHLDRFVERNGLNGARLYVAVIGNLVDADYHDETGTDEGSNVGSFSGTFPMRSDDGRTYVASYEVIYWWD